MRFDWWKEMKVSDYIVDFLIKKGITDVFGYPGGSVTNLIDSFRKQEVKISAHVMYHEQAAAFAACSYAIKNGVPGVAYSTGGPGATNMLTAIGHAFYDSIPVIFLTGNVNTYEAKSNLSIRQKGFQESDIISVSSPLTKLSIYVDKPENIRYCLEKAYSYATSGRPGPVLIDLPMDVLRAQVTEETLVGYEEFVVLNNTSKELFAKMLTKALNNACAPCIVLGNGVKTSKLQEIAKVAINNVKIPYVTSMIAFDVLGPNNYFYGFIGAYGIRMANFVVAKSDLIISIGSRLDVRQVGAIRENFAPNAEIIRVDIDEGELEYKVHKDEKAFCINAKEALEVMATIKVEKDYCQWIATCNNISAKLYGLDNRVPNEYVEKISELVPEGSVITTDVGQNQVWVAQSFKLKSGQQFMFSGGMGAMGHALPAAIGACYPKKDKPVICICGDGGLQMNIQELQYIFRERLPVKIIVFNNYSLGMIRHFQEIYFDNISFQTTETGGYTTPDFTKIAEAYGIHGKIINDPLQVNELRNEIKNDEPILIEIRIVEDTYVFPKLEYGKPNQDQQPLIDRNLFKELMEM